MEKKKEKKKEKTKEKANAEEEKKKKWKFLEGIPNFRTIMQTCRSYCNITEATVAVSKRFWLISV